MKVKVGDGINSTVSGWNFSGDVAKNFDKHVSKSVPMYKDGHDLICDISGFFIKEGSIVYDIGCSTGSLIMDIAIHNNKKENVKYIGVDIESDMIKIANEKKRGFPRIDVDFVNDNALFMDMEKSDMIVCYYTNQFIRPSDRQDFINKVYDSLNWGGALIMFEKTRGADARFQDILTSLYTDYKIRSGYSSEDIISKSRSLRGVLEPFSTSGNIDMLKRSGFKDINTIFKYICFEGFLAIK